MKYRKKAVVVEASQWWKPGDHAAVSHPLPPEVHLPSDGRKGERGAVEARGRFGAIKTLEGWMVVTPGDFIICGVQGEYYACKPDIFGRTYEAVEENATPE